MAQRRAWHVPFCFHTRHQWERVGLVRRNRLTDPATNFPPRWWEKNGRWGDEEFFIYSFTSSSAHSVIHLIIVTRALAGDPRDKYNENPIPQGACSPAEGGPSAQMQSSRKGTEGGEETRKGNASGSRVGGKTENTSKNQGQGAGLGEGTRMDKKPQQRAPWRIPIRSREMTKGHGDDTPSRALTWLLLLTPSAASSRPLLFHPAPRYSTASATFLKFAFAKKGRFWNRRRFQCLGHPRLFWASQVAGCHLELLIRKSSLIDSINSESISFDIGDPKVTFILSVKDRVS